MKTENDPLFAASTASAIQSTDVTNWNAAFGWGNHASAGYLKNESDPVFAASAASTIQATDMTRWNTGYGWGNHADAGYLTAETDPQVTVATANSVPRWDGTTLVAGQIIDTGSAIRVTVGVTSTLDQNVTLATTGSTGSTIWQSFTAAKTGVLGKITLNSNGCAASTVTGTLNVFNGHGVSGAKIFSQPVSVACAETHSGTPCNSAHQGHPRSPAFVTHLPMCGLSSCPPGCCGTNSGMSSGNLRIGNVGANLQKTR